MEKKVKKDINEILNKRIKRERKIERIIGIVGLIGGMILGIRILMWMVTLIN